MVGTVKSRHEQAADVWQALENQLAAPLG